MNGVGAATRLSVPCSLDQAATARRRLRAELHERRVPRAVVMDAELVLGELLGNALLHGRPRPDGSIGVQWSVVDGGGVRLQVTDGGSPPPLRAFRAPSFASTGRGLGIVSQLAEEWGVELHDPGVTVWALVSEH